MTSTSRRSTQETGLERRSVRLRHRCGRAVYGSGVRDWSYARADGVVHVRTCGGRRQPGRHRMDHRPIGVDMIITNIGSVRGSCGHKHRAISGAARCLRDDRIGCIRQGGYSDRCPRVTGHESINVSVEDIVDAVIEAARR